ncbi:hypothetical protein [Cupriavidus metallidurans]|uniref:Helix-turn-helix domain-containing protein n=1 Tax=Cupriavidus metallidurans (strain ATCC 43123 / DSM 2839 / NBRC 102507 / CH34) TaxID=266264 RepID=Q1LLU1_CUPMC|nr:hypothetical protein [Cupriavidus metallidurans]ABF08885.1 conserved hypothetical protein [Cupriavidus metallidurans CH34]QGS30213.1 hypothetical protein FOB83_15690 [Cupriavidus metallidurans]
MSKSKPTEKREVYPGKFAAVPEAILYSSAVVSLSDGAFRLLVCLLSRHNGANNGHLSATQSALRPHGWASKSKLERALTELVEHRLLVRAREGGPHCAALYALSWLPILNYNGLHLTPDTYPRGAWADYRATDNGKARRRVSRANGKPRDSGGIAPAYGAMRATDGTLHGQPIAPKSEKIAPYQGAHCPVSWGEIAPPYGEQETESPLDTGQSEANSRFNRPSVRGQLHSCQCQVGYDGEVLDLLPCPRCGGAPTVLELARGDLPPLWLVSCRNARCGVRPGDTAGCA